jgi:hypothetical protein
MKKYRLLLLFAGTAIMIVVMTKTGAALKTPATPKGILDLEFAYNKIKTENVLNAWAPNNSTNNISTATNNTYYDFIFLFFYSLFLFYTCKKIAGINNNKFGLLIAKGALWAGFLDIFENTGMLITLSGNSSGIIALCTTIISVIKWALAIAAVIYLLVGLIQLLITKKTHLLLT